MNIKEAKNQIKNAITAYFTKDDYGNYELPIEKQRPIFLMGPPGIGKTAIMEQIAAEMGVGILSYSMTHHTRQSALGLPFIEHKNYGGKEYAISEYTMSEIIASVYDMMEETGVKEGILFLDEINCVSETLSPIMLQFLQYKVFGRHRVPDGWIVVTAGNPPEYNNSVREFDIVTWDRLKRVDVEPDFDAWKEYAYKAGVHASVMTYLEIKKSDFYQVKSTVDGKQFVTARGWDDLSQMIWLYEKKNLVVDENLIQQYLQNKKIAKEFAVYYDLFNKYRSDYQVDTIIEGNVSAEIKERASSAKFDERLSLIGLILDAINQEIRDTMNMDQLLHEYVEVLREYKMLMGAKGDPVETMQKAINKQRKALDNGKQSGSIDSDHRKRMIRMIDIMEKQKQEIMTSKKASESTAEAFKLVKKNFDEMVNRLKKSSEEVVKKLNNVFLFIDEVYSEGQEMLIVVTELTANYHSSKFISRYGCEEYFKHNKSLLFYERHTEIMRELDEIEL